MGSGKQVELVSRSAEAPSASSCRQSYGARLHWTLTTGTDRTRGMELELYSGRSTIIEAILGSSLLGQQDNPGSSHAKAAIRLGHGLMVGLLTEMKNAATARRMPATINNQATARMTVNESERRCWPEARCGCCCRIV